MRLRSNTCVGGRQSKNPNVTVCAVPPLVRDVLRSGGSGRCRKRQEQGGGASVCSERERNRRVGVLHAAAHAGTWVGNSIMRQTPCGDMPTRKAHSRSRWMTSSTLSLSFIIQICSTIPHHEGNCVLALDTHANFARLDGWVKDLCFSFLVERKGCGQTRAATLFPQMSAPHNLATLNAVSSVLALNEVSWMQHGSRCILDMEHMCWGCGSPE